MRKKLLFFSLAISAIVLFLLVAGYIFLTSSFTGESVEKFINSHARWKEGHLQVRGVTFDPLQGIQLASVAIADKNDNWLSAQNVDLEWEIHFFPFQLVFPKIHTSQVSLAELPQQSEKNKKNSLSELFSFTIPRLPFLPVTLSCPDISIDEIYLSKKILGQQISYAFQGNLKLSAKEAKGEATVTGLSDKAGNANLTLVLDDKETLSIQAQATEPSKGTLGSLLQIPNGAELTAKGKGKLADWNGELIFQSPDWGKIENALHLSIKNKKIKARLDTLLSWSPNQMELQNWLGKQNKLSLEAVLQENKIFCQQLSLTTIPATITASGLFAQDGLQADLIADIHDTSRLEDFYLTIKPGAPLHISLNGPFSGIDVKASLGIKNLRLPSFVAQHLKAAFSGKLTLDSQANLEGKINLCAQQITPHLLQFHTIEASSFIKTSFTNLVAKHTKITSQEFALSSKEPIIIDSNGASLKGNLAVTRFDVASLEPYLGSGWKGNIRAFLDIKGNNANQELKLQLSSSDLYSPQIDMEKLAGEKLQLVGTATLTPQEFSWGAVKLIADQASLLTTGKLNWESNKLDVQAEGSINSLVALDKELQGQAYIKAKVSGDMELPSLHLLINSPKINYAGNVFKNLELQSDFDPITRKGKINFDMQHLDKPVLLRSVFKMEKNSFRLLQANLEGLELKAKASARLLKGGKEGEFYVQLENSNLRQIGKIAGIPLYGDITGKISGIWKEKKLRGNLSLQGKKTGLVASNKGSIDLKGTFTGTPALPHINLNGEIYSFSFSQNQMLHKAILGFKGNLQNAKVSIKAVGRTFFPFTVQSEIKLKKQSQNTEIFLSNLKGRLGPDKLTLAAPSLLNLSSQGFVLSPLNLNWGEGKVSLKGKTRQDCLTFVCDLKKISTYLPSTFLPIQEHGLISLDAKVSGQLQSPKISANFKATDLVPAEATGTKNGISLSGGLSYHQQEAKLNSVLSNGHDSSLKIHANAPVKIDLSQMIFALTGKAQSTIKGQIRLNWFPAMLNLEDHAISAMAWIDTQATWENDNFSLAGEARINGGKYEALTTGTVLRRLNLAMTFKDKDIDLSFSARDTKQGKITTEGSLHLADIPSFKAKLTSKNFLAIKNDLATASIDSNLTLNGDIKSCLLTGEVIFNSTAIDLSATSSSTFTTLEVTEIDDSGTVINKKEKVSTKKSPLDLNIRVNVPNHFFARGRGLDSEWKASLLIRGNASSPSLTGNLKVLRGKYQFAGRDFHLATEKKSQIQFIGTFPPDPALDIHAVSKVDDIVVKLLVQGVASDFSFTLLSEPSLPEDEILSRVLFGRSVDTISPVQAMHLALTLNQLTQKNGSGFDIIGEARNVLGVDNINIDSDGTSGVSVGVGKYLTEKIYVEVVKKADAKEDSISVEMELAPHLSLDTEVGGTEGGKIELKWKKDY